MVVWDKSGGLHCNPSLYRFSIVPSLRAGFAKQSIGVSNRTSGLPRGETARNDDVMIYTSSRSGSVRSNSNDAASIAKRPTTPY